MNKMTLKWETLKGCKFESEAGMAAVKAYAEAGNLSASAMMQEDTPAQKEALCAMIDLADEIWNDWSGKKMTKEAAKDYVLNYGKD